MDVVSETGHGSEGLVQLPLTRQAVVEVGDISELTTPPLVSGVFFGEWSDADPDETPFVFGEWDDVATEHELVLETWDA